jgi:long-chain acyl-CoA synthetase|eukprot:COSAG01_NODE_3191_length_6436_cov_14.338646_5_plen_76_part_00
MCEVACMMQGAKIGYASPRTLTPASVYNPPDAITDLGALRPTLMAAVPAILEIIRTGLIQKVTGESPHSPTAHRS